MQNEYDYRENLQKWAKRSFKLSLIGIFLEIICFSSIHQASLQHSLGGIPGIFLNFFLVMPIFCISAIFGIIGLVKYKDFEKNIENKLMIIFGIVVGFVGIIVSFYGWYYCM